MFFVAAALLLVAILMFAIQAVRENFASMTNIGLGFFSGGMLAWLIWALEEAGKI